jgi:branched-chain amino acid transport system permease protein
MSQSKTPPSLKNTVDASELRVVPSAARRLRLDGESWLVPALLATPLGLLALAAQLSSSGSAIAIVTELNIRVIAVVAIYIFSGNSGILSYGHVALMGVGAYASSWETCCPTMKPIMMNGLPDFLKFADWPVVPSAIGASSFTALVAFFSGLVVMRLQNVAAGIATFAFLFVFNSIYDHWDSVTMGVSSIIGLPQYITPVYSWVWVLAAICGAFLFQNSAAGVLLRASRDEETAARACGANIFWLRVLAFTISGFYAGMAGVILAHHLGTISVDTFFLDLTFTLLAMLVVGGLRSLSGAVSGAVAVSLIIELLRALQLGFSFGDQQFSLPAGSVQIGVALAMLTILIFRRNGLTSGREFPVERWIFRRNSR